MTSVQCGHHAWCCRRSIESNLPVFHASTAYGLLLRDVNVTAFLAHSLRKFVGFFAHHQCTKNRPRTLNKRELNASCHLVLDFCAIRSYFVNAYHSLRMELSRDNGATIMPFSRQHDATPDFTQGDSCAWGDSHAWNTGIGMLQRL